MVTFSAGLVGKRNVPGGVSTSRLKVEKDEFAGENVVEELGVKRPCSCLCPPDEISASKLVRSMGFMCQ